MYQISVVKDQHGVYHPQSGKQSLFVWRGTVLLVRYPSIMIRSTMFPTGVMWKLQCRCVDVCKIQIVSRSIIRKLDYYEIILKKKQLLWFKHILLRRKGLGVVLNTHCALPHLLSGPCIWLGLITVVAIFEGNHDDLWLRMMPQWMLSWTWNDPFEFKLKTFCLVDRIVSEAKFSMSLQISPQETTYQILLM